MVKKCQIGPEWGVDKGGNWPLFDERHLEKHSICCILEPKIFVRKPLYLERDSQWTIWWFSKKLFFSHFRLFPPKTARNTAYRAFLTTYLDTKLPFNIRKKRDFSGFLGYLE